MNNITFKDGSILCDPTAKQLTQGVSTLLFVFSNRDGGGVPGLVTTYTEGLVDMLKLQECVTAASVAAKEVFQFYIQTVSRKFSKEGLN